MSIYRFRVKYCRKVHRQHTEFQMHAKVFSRPVCRYVESGWNTTTKYTGIQNSICTPKCFRVLYVDKLSQGEILPQSTQVYRIPYARQSVFASCVSINWVRVKYCHKAHRLIEFYIHAKVFSRPVCRYVESEWNTITKHTGIYNSIHTPKCFRVLYVDKSSKGEILPQSTQACIQNSIYTPKCFRIMYVDISSQGEILPQSTHAYRIPYTRQSVFASCMSINRARVKYCHITHRQIYRIPYTRQSIFASCVLTT